MNDKHKSAVHYSEAPVEFKNDISGWVDVNGRFYGSDEHMARWASCDVLDCASEGCGNTVRKHSFTICDDCREKKRKAKYALLEIKAWDGLSLLYSDSHDRYFEDTEELQDYMDENNISIKDLYLTTCRPINIRTLDDDYFTEELHEDAQLPDEIVNAIEKLNGAILKHGKAVSWMPDKYAAIVDL